jgi:hypothetical protein
MASAHFVQTRLILFLLALSLGLIAQARAQHSFSEGSGLSRPSFVRDSVKEISDSELWNAIDVDRPGLEHVRQSVRAGDLEQAVTAWAAYWSAKSQPTYITFMDHLLLDTDMLMPVAEFREAMVQSPEERSLVLARGDKILQNTIKTWGDSVVDYGEKVDFNREIGQSGKYGFHYWIWSRPLVMSWAITGNEKYLAKFDQLFQWWYQQRNSITRTIPEFDVVYYELGLGIRNRAFLEYYLSPFPRRSRQTHLQMLKTFLAASRWLYEVQRWEGYRAGNWQIHGAYMLSQIGLAFPEFRESPEWRRMGLQRMMEHMRQDFFPDGGHSERSPRNYTLGTYLGFRNLAYLLSAYGMEEDTAAQIRASMGRTIEWWRSIITPTGEIPAINDSHRGLFPQRVLSDGAALFLSGKEPAPRVLSRHMPESGFTVMRSDSTSNALYLLLNYGPNAGFHTHYDLLDFELYAYGRALAVDAGVGSTYDDPLYPDWYRASRAHNMVAVNDSNIERQNMRGENIRWASTPSVDYFSGEQNGYRRFGVTQRRQIAFVKPSYWFTLDDVHSSRGGDTLSWYFHSPVPLVPMGPGYISASAPGIRIVPVGVKCTTLSGKGVAASTTDMTPGKTESIGWIRFDQISLADSTREFPILLFPFRKAAATVNASKLSSGHFVVKHEASEDHLYFPNGIYSDGTVETDGSFVIVREEKDHRRTFTIINGTYLRYRTRIIWSSTTLSSAEGRIP